MDGQLSDAFWQDSGRDAPELDKSLAEAFSAAQQRWPSIGLDAERFASELGELFAREGDESLDPAKWLAGRRLEELFLAIAIRHRVPTAVDRFEESYGHEIDMAARRVDKERRFSDDIAQSTRIRLLVGSETKPPKISAYTGKGPLGRWLTVVTTRDAYSFFRSVEKAIYVDEIESVVESKGQNAGIPLDKNEAERIKSIYKDAFRQALTSSLADLPDEERRWVRAYFFEGQTYESLAKLTGTSAPTMYRRVKEIMGRVNQATLETLRSQYGLGEGEMTSFVDYVRSRLDMSFGGALKSGG